MTEIICAVVNKTTASTLFQVVMSDEQANSWLDYNLKRQEEGVPAFGLGSKFVLVDKRIVSDTTPAGWKVVANF